MNFNKQAVDIINNLQPSANLDIAVDYIKGQLQHAFLDGKIAILKELRAKREADKVAQ